MKSAVFYGKHDIKVEEVEMPQLGNQDVLIKVMACGICGTDVHIYEGDKGAANTTPPTILGHEFAGIVEAVGHEVKHVKVGDRVCVDPNQLCGTCYYCRSGIGHFCEDMIGIGTTRDGGFAQYCAVNESQVYKLADTTSFEEGAMTEPVACCLHGINTVIECAGLPATIKQAISLAGNKSVVMMFGLTKPDDEVAIKPFEIFQKEIEIKASFINPYTQQRALDLINSKKIDVSSMVCDICSLDKLADILSKPELRNKGKYIINPWQ